MEKTAPQIAEEKERRIVRFTNIDKESFTHAFRGIKITIKAGQSYMARLPEGEHLALHLARKMISRDKKAKGADKDPKGTILYTDVEIDEIKKKIIQEVGKDTPEKITPEQERQKDLKRIDKEFKPKEKPDDVSKANVIKSLKERGIEPDINKSKEELLTQLMEVESQGK